MIIRLIFIFTFFTFLTKSLNADSKNLDLTFYTGVFDTIDKEGDDQTNLVGIEHRNTDLFRDTILGKISPVTVMFLTDKN